MPRGELILLTGASGYVGGRLRRALEADGRRLRCMARRPEYLRERVEAGTEVVAGDVLEPETLAAALDGVHTAYYLVHSMASSRDYAATDRRGAEAFARAARAAGVRRIVYLGGLGEGTHLSRHLASRQEVGRILREQADRAFQMLQSQRGLLDQLAEALLAKEELDDREIEAILGKSVHSKQNGQPIEVSPSGLQPAPA